MFKKITILFIFLNIKNMSTSKFSFILITFIHMPFLFFCQNTEKTITYYENGNIKEVENRKHNRLDGEYLEYYNNNNLFVFGQYENGIPSGNWIEFYETGDTLSKYKFIKSVLIYNKNEIKPTIKYKANSIDSLKAGIENTFQIIFPDYPNKFISVTINNGYIMKLGRTEYKFATKHSGEVNIYFFYRKTNNFHFKQKDGELSAFCTLKTVTK